MQREGRLDSRIQQHTARQSGRYLNTLIDDAGNGDITNSLATRNRAALTNLAVTMEEAARTAALGCPPPEEASSRPQVVAFSRWWGGGRKKYVTHIVDEDVNRNLRADSTARQGGRCVAFPHTLGLI